MQDLTLALGDLCTEAENMGRDFSGLGEVSKCPALVPGKMAQQEKVVAAEPVALNSNSPYPHGVTTYRI